MFGIDDALLGGVVSGLGSFLGGNQQAKMTKEGIAEQKREYDLSNMGGAARQAENAPLRDKLMAIFGQMLNQAPQRFTPRDAFNPTNGMAPAKPQYGGMNMQNMATPAGYKLGDGGVNPAIYQQILAGLGYKDPSQQTPQTPQAPQAPGGINGSAYPGQRPYFGAPFNMPQRPR